MAIQTPGHQGTVPKNKSCSTRPLTKPSVCPTHSKHLLWSGGTNAQRSGPPPPSPSCSLCRQTASLPAFLGARFGDILRQLNDSFPVFFQRRYLTSDCRGDLCLKTFTGDKACGLDRGQCSCQHHKGSFLLSMEFVSLQKSCSEAVHSREADGVGFNFCSYGETS